MRATNMDRLRSMNEAESDSEHDDWGDQRPPRMNFPGGEAPEQDSLSERHDDRTVEVRHRQDE